MWLRPSGPNNTYQFIICIKWNQYICQIYKSCSGGLYCFSWPNPCNLLQHKAVCPHLCCIYVNCTLLQKPNQTKSHFVKFPISRMENIQTREVATQQEECNHFTLFKAIVFSSRRAAVSKGTVSLVLMCQLHSYLMRSAINTRKFNCIGKKSKPLVLLGLIYCIRILANLSFMTYYKVIKRSFMFLMQDAAVLPLNRCDLSKILEFYDLIEAFCLCKLLWYL